MEGTLKRWKVYLRDGRYTSEMGGILKRWKVLCLNAILSAFTSKTKFNTKLKYACIYIYIYIYIHM